MKTPDANSMGASPTTVNLTAMQRHAFAQLANFLESPTQRVFLLRGCAGTGKTYLIGHFTKHISAQSRQAVVCAPTGRAARSLYSRAGCIGQTIHSTIYRQDDTRPEDLDAESNLIWKFSLRSNTYPDGTVFIVDEASMISDTESYNRQLQYGSGRLLNDFLEYVGICPMNDSMKRNKVVFVGDPAQLPPIGCSDSPALSREYLRVTYGIDSQETDLTEIKRQAQGSTILLAANNIRRCIEQNSYERFEIIHGANVQRAEAQYYKYGLPIEMAARPQDTLVVTSTNSLALRHNQHIRKHLHGPQITDLSTGDRILVVANNIQNGRLNGDFATVLEADGNSELRIIRLRNHHCPIHLAFRNVTLHFDEDPVGQHSTVKILENVLHSSKRQLDDLELLALRIDFEQRTKLKYPRLSLAERDSKAYQSLKEGYLTALAADPYFNALQVKFGFAVTCHKAQGGEWKNVYIDFRTFMDKRTSEFFRWSYTATTRASQTLYTMHVPVN